MTTTAQKRKSGPSAAKPVKKPRIRGEFLPDTARYVTVDDKEYVCVPVEDFGEWYEDIEDRAVLEYAADDPAPPIPAETVHSMK